MNARLWTMVLLAGSVCPFAQAANTAYGPILAEAEIPTQFSLEVALFDATSGQELSSLDFGELKREGDHLRSDRTIRVLLKVQTNGEAYEVKQQASPLVHSGGPEAIPSGAFLVTPVYSADENSGRSLPAQAKLGTAGPALGTKTLLADTTGSSRVLSAIYALSSDSASGSGEPIPADQPSGAYSGTLQFTLTST